MEQYYGKDQKFKNDTVVEKIRGKGATLKAIWEFMIAEIGDRTFVIVFLLSITFTNLVHSNEGGHDEESDSEDADPSD